MNTEITCFGVKMKGPVELKGNVNFNVSGRTLEMSVGKLHKKSSLKPSQRRTSRMIQHQLFIWKYEATGGCRVLCGECHTFFDSTLTKLAEGETCPNCKAMYADIDVDETGQCNHGIIGNGEVFTIKRLINSNSLNHQSTNGERQNEIL